MWTNSVRYENNSILIICQRVLKSTPRKARSEVGTIGADIAIGSESCPNAQHWLLTISSRETGIDLDTEAVYRVDTLVDTHRLLLVGHGTAWTPTYHREYREDTHGTVWRPCGHPLLMENRVDTHRLLLVGHGTV